MQEYVNSRNLATPWRAPGDTDEGGLILYYFELAINTFVLGDFENSFMNSFKIVFDFGFKRIHQIKNYDERRPKYREIRAAIAHPKKDELFEDVTELKKFKKNLYDDTLEILRIVKNEFLDYLTTYSS